jgi:hypothetical protein
MTITDEQIDQGGTWHDPAKRAEYVAVMDQITAAIAECKREQATAPMPERLALTQRLAERMRGLSSHAVTVRALGWHAAEKG